MPDGYDATEIGGRHHGLSCACYLASACLIVLSSVLGVPTKARAAEEESASGAEGAVTNAGPERLEHDIRVVVSTNAPPVAAGTNQTPKTTQWDASWRGWDGLHLEMHQRTFLPDMSRLWRGAFFGSNAPSHIQLEQVKMTINLGARVEVDGAAFVNPDNLAGFDDGVQLRRAFINLGGDCILLTPLSYKIQIGYIPSGFYINEAYLKFPPIKYIGSLQFGEFRPPMGLDLITSSRDITFMEPAAPLQAIGPPNEAGIQIGHPVFNQRATWALGIFGNANPNNEYGNSSRNYGNAIGRVTWLPIDHPSLEHPSDNRYLHLGLSAGFLYSASSTSRYRSRPESYLAPYVIDTGDVEAVGAATVAGEAAWVNGPFSAQGEIIHSFVEQNNGGSLNFGGFYGQASWYLTGESRPYDRSTGAFRRLVPRRNFNFGKDGGWGALEVGARYSYTDLTDANVHGGRLSELMASLNWYLNAHVRWMFNYGMGHISGGASDGNIYIFQTRIGADF